jgi:hypothetical protein
VECAANAACGLSSGAQLMLRFQRYLLPMAFLSNGTAKRISIAFTAQQLFKCNMRDDASK